MEKQNQDNSIESILLNDYILYLLVNSMIETYSVLKENINSKDINNLKQKLNLLSQDINVNAYFELDTIISDEYQLYEFLRQFKNPQISIPAFVTSSEYISDYVLQETINNYMMNQRSGVVTMNQISADSIYHSCCGGNYLAETHDIKTTIVKSKRYYETREIIIKKDNL